MSSNSSDRLNGLPPAALGDDRGRRQRDVDGSDRGFRDTLYHQIAPIDCLNDSERGRPQWRVVPFLNSLVKRSCIALGIPVRVVSVLATTSTYWLEAACGGRKLRGVRGCTGRNDTSPLIPAIRWEFRYLLAFFFLGGTLLLPGNEHRFTTTSYGNSSSQLTLYVLSIVGGSTRSRLSCRVLDPVAVGSAVRDDLPGPASGRCQLRRVSH